MLAIFVKLLRWSFVHIRENSDGREQDGESKLVLPVRWRKSQISAMKALLKALRRNKPGVRPLSLLCTEFQILSAQSNRQKQTPLPPFGPKIR